MQMNTYLFFDGRCAEAFRFYEQLLGGQIEFMQKAGDTPERDRMPPEQHDIIMHVRMRVGDQVLMGSDAPPPHFEKPQGFFVSLQIDEPAEAERIFNGLAEGAEVRMPLQKTFWAAHFGMLVDRFGTPWMVNCEMGD